MTSIVPRPAATVMLVRDSAAGMEVFMLRRNANAVFVGGAHVFPGGKVDDADQDDPDLPQLCVGLDDAEASRRMGIGTGGLAYWVAVIRECFEEAGVLLAHDPDGKYLPFVAPDVVERFDAYRRLVHAGERRLVEVCEGEGLTLAVDDLQYFGHWITPEGSPRRFDTRFFVARAPDEQEPLHDGSETVASRWIRPADALAAHEAGDFAMITPTIWNLDAIKGFDHADDLVDAAAVEGRSGPRLRFQGSSEDGGWRIRLPGD